MPVTGIRRRVALPTYYIFSSIVFSHILCPSNIHPSRNRSESDSCLECVSSRSPGPLALPPGNQNTCRDKVDVGHAAAVDAPVVPTRVVGARARHG